MEAVVERVGMMVSDGLSFHHDRNRLPHAPPAAPGGTGAGRATPIITVGRRRPSLPSSPAASSAHFRAHSAAISSPAERSRRSPTRRRGGFPFHFLSSLIFHSREKSTWPVIEESLLGGRRRSRGRMVGGAKFITPCDFFRAASPSLTPR